MALFRIWDTLKHILYQAKSVAILCGTSNTSKKSTTAAPPINEHKKKPYINRSLLKNTDLLPYAAKLVVNQILTTRVILKNMKLSLIYHQFPKGYLIEQ